VLGLGQRDRVRVRGCPNPNPNKMACLENKTNSPSGFGLRLAIYGEAPKTPSPTSPAETIPSPRRLRRYGSNHICLVVYSEMVPLVYKYNKAIIAQELPVWYHCLILGKTEIFVFFDLNWFE